MKGAGVSKMGSTHRKLSIGSVYDVAPYEKPLSPTAMALQMLTTRAKYRTKQNGGQADRDKGGALMEDKSVTDKISMSYGLSQDGSEALAKQGYSITYTNPRMMTTGWTTHKKESRARVRARIKKAAQSKPESPFVEQDLGPFIINMCLVGEENRKKRVAESIQHITSLTDELFSQDATTDLSGTMSPSHIVPGSIRFKEDAKDPDVLISRFKVDPTHLFNASFDSIETIQSVRSMMSTTQGDELQEAIAALTPREVNSKFLRSASAGSGLDVNPQFRLSASTVSNQSLDFGEEVQEE